MVRRDLFCAAILVAGLAGHASAATWNTFVIRNSGGGNSPQINDVVVGSTAAKEFVINEGSMKAAWGTSSVDGLSIGDLTAISIQRLDDVSRYDAGSGPARAPYINIWITDGLGKFAVIANEPTNPEWQNNEQWDMDWDILKTKTVKAFENSDKSWLPNNGVGMTFENLAGFTIQAPTPAQLSTGWSGLGSGAPRELSTNVAYGFNWVFGDTQSNYLSEDDGYIVADPEVLPEPTTAILLLVGGVVTLRRRMRQVE